MNKRGAIQDLFWFIIVLFISALLLLIMAQITTSFHDGMTGSTGVSQYTESALDVVKNVGDMSDTMFLIIFAGYVLALIVTAMLVNFHPAFYFVFFILTIIAVVVSAPLSNSFDDIAATAEFAPHAANAPIMIGIMGNLPFVVGTISVLLMVVMYAKSRGGDEGGI